MTKSSISGGTSPGISWRTSTADTPALIRRILETKGKAEGMFQIKDFELTTTVLS